MFNFSPMSWLDSDTFSTLSLNPLYKVAHVLFEFILRQVTNTNNETNLLLNKWYTVNGDDITVSYFKVGHKKLL